MASVQFKTHLLCFNVFDELISQLSSKAKIQFLTVFEFWTVYLNKTSKFKTPSWTVCQHFSAFSDVFFFFAKQQIEKLSFSLNGHDTRSALRPSQHAADHRQHQTASWCTLFSRRWTSPGTETVGVFLVFPLGCLSWWCWLRNGSHFGDPSSLFLVFFCAPSKRCFGSCRDGCLWNMQQIRCDF